MTRALVAHLACGALVVLGALAAGCDQRGSSTQQPPATAAPATADAAPPMLLETDLPVQADFEQEAANEITADTYKAELDALAKELEGR